MYQQKIPLRGSEASLNLFTELLRELKGSSADHSSSSADVLLAAAMLWRNRPHTLKAECTASARFDNGQTHAFYLQLLTSTRTQHRISEELDALRRDLALKSVIDRDGTVSRNDFLLEALIVILQLLKLQTKSGGAKTSPEISEAPRSTSSCPVQPRACASGIPRQSREQRRYGERRHTASELDAMHDEHSPPLGRQTRIVCTPRSGPWENRRETTPLANAASSPCDRNYASTPEPECRRREGRSSTPGFYWRQQLRQQQLTEHRHLNEMVRRNSKKYSFSSSRESSVEREPPRRPLQPTNRNILSPKNIELLDSRFSRWTPVHAEAMKKRYSAPSADDAGDKENSGLTIELKPKLCGDSRHPNSGGGKSPPSPMEKVELKYDFENNCGGVPSLTLQERKRKAEILNGYLLVSAPDVRPVPGVSAALSQHERVREGIDCDEVFSRIVLGNGATLRKKEYLRRIGVTHILNAAEFRGVNLGKDYFDGEFHYLGVRIEDTPQTQICRHFTTAVAFIVSALNSPGGLLYVNCVFGKSRSTTFVVAFLMVQHDWTAIDALKHIRQKRNVQINYGFQQQLADLDHKLNWMREQAAAKKAQEASVAGGKNRPPAAQ